MMIGSRFYIGDGTAAPVGAAHWWDFADAESGVATDRIGGVRLQIPPGFVTRATPWSS